MATVKYESKRLKILLQFFPLGILSKQCYSSIISGEVSIQKHFRDMGYIEKLSSAYKEGNQKYEDIYYSITPKGLNYLKIHLQDKIVWMQYMKIPKRLSKLGNISSIEKIGLLSNKTR